MLREYKLYLDDIKEAIKKINNYTKGISYKEFYKKDIKRIKR